jgi:hypothetical protein
MAREAVENVAPDTEQERLARAEAAFARGDFGALRGELRGLSEAASPEVRTRAVQLGHAVGEDPVFAAVVAACLLGLFVVFAVYVLR